MKATATILFALLGLFAAAVHAQENQPRQEPVLLRQAVEHFLNTQAAGLPGKVEIRVGAVDPRLNLPACVALEPFLPNGSRVWGKTTVGVRCNVPTPWTVYVPATVKVVGEYVVAAAPLGQGQVLTAQQLTKIKGDLTTLPAGIVTDPAQAVGRSMAVSVAAGTPLRQDVLRSQQVVQQGQIIRLVSDGPGFQVTAEARALASGSEGQVIQARTQSGQVVSGVARAGGVLSVTY